MTQLYKIIWEFTSGLEAQRTSLVTAINKKDALFKLRRDHVDLNCQLRQDIKVIDVRPARHS